MDLWCVKCIYATSRWANSNLVPKVLFMFFILLVAAVLPNEMCEYFEAKYGIPLSAGPNG